MLGLICWTIGLLVLAVLLLMAGKVWLSWKNLDFYRAQGIYVDFHPIKGAFGIFDKNLPRNKAARSARGELKYITNNEGKSGVFATNRMASTNSAIQIYSAAYIKEFLIKEDSFYKSNVLPNYSDMFGFFFQDGEKAFESKAVFAKLFAYDGMDTFCPMMSRTIKKGYAEWAEKLQLGKDWKVADLNPLFPPLMEKITALLMFGKMDLEHGSEEFEILEGCIRLVELVFELIKNPLYLLSPWLAEKLRYLPALRKIPVETKIQKERIRKYMAKLESSGNLGESVFERIIAYNKTNPEKPLTEHDIFGTANLIYFAAFDTSQSVAKMGLCTLATRPDLQEELRKAGKEILGDGKQEPDSKSIENHPVLGLWFKETMRRNNTVGASFVRVAKKDVNLLDLKIRAGDCISLHFTGLNFNENVFPSANEFQLQRFANKEIESGANRYHYIPFSAGKRICMGRHMGELTVKLFIIHFLDCFDFEIPPGHTYFEDQLIMVNEAYPLVRIRTRAR